MASSRNSTQSATGSLRSSKMVPVTGVKALQHERQTHLRTPRASLPLRTMRGEPHLGQASRA